MLNLAFMFHCFRSKCHPRRVPWPMLDEESTIAGVKKEASESAFYKMVSNDCLKELTTVTKDH